MAALDDAIAHLDTIISRLRSRRPSDKPAQNASEKNEGASSRNLSVPSEAKSEEAVVAKSQAVTSSNVSVSSSEGVGKTSSSEGLKPPVEGPDPVEDFDKAHLQVGQVVSVEEHPVAEKLYVCKVEIAQDQVKQVVAGLRKFLPSKELLGKKVCLILNLKPAKLAGQLSEAMILAGDAQIDGAFTVKVLQPPPDACVGDRIFLEGSSPSAKPAKQLSSKIWEKLVPLLRVEGGVAKFSQRPLVTSSGTVTASDLPDGSSIH